MELMGMMKMNNKMIKFKWMTNMQRQCDSKNSELLSSSPLLIKLDRYKKKKKKKEKKIAYKKLKKMISWIQ